MHRIWEVLKEGVAVWHALGAIVSGLLWLGSRAMDVDRTWVIGFGIASVYCLLVAIGGLAFSRRNQWRSAFKEARLRQTHRRWTDAGLSWAVKPESHTALRDGRMTAILDIAPILGSELPQPLDIFITCAGSVAEVSSKFFLDGSTNEFGLSGDVEIWPPTKNTISLRLVSPKLLPPSRWELSIVSGGNAAVRVLSVKRAPAA